MLRFLIIDPFRNLGVGKTGVPVSTCLSHKFYAGGYRCGRLTFYKDSPHHTIESTFLTSSGESTPYEEQSTFTYLYQPLPSGPKADADSGVSADIYPKTKSTAV
jgi:hypothetical protein